jgi:superfamily I DNA/RNA helicase
MTFNDQQRAVIDAVDGVWVVIAGPGSGKTACMVERHIQMLMKGISQRDILNLTFTNSAATEAAKRVGLLNAEQVFRTFHSFALELIKRERAHVPFALTDTVIPVRGEDYQLLFDLTKQFPAISSFRTLQGQLSEWKRSNIEPKQAMDEAVGKEYYYALAYEEYEKKCRAQGWLDFDSLMHETVKLLETNEDVRNRNKKKYLSVDECQDTDITQFKFLKLLFSDNIVVVGDENQLIYEWRSAQPGNLSNFEQQYPGATKLYLGQNYRSTKKLVNFFKEIIPEDNGIASHMKTENPEGVEPRFIRFSDQGTEIAVVLDETAKDPENSVILARTNRQLFDVQREAVSRGIRYRNLGKRDFFDQSEVKALLRLAKDAPQSLSASDALRNIIRDHNLYNRYRSSGDGMYSDPIENMNNLVKMAAAKGTVGEFLDWSRRAAYGRKSKKEKDLTLSTIHLFKGRESKHVYLIGTEQGKLPHRDGELSEERRLWFVACSRASETLQISWSGNRSMFIPESRISEIEEYHNDGT